MRKYFAISLGIYIIATFIILILKYTLGGETKVPLGWSIGLSVIVLNTIFSMVLFLIQLIRGKL